MENELRSFAVATLDLIRDIAKNRAGDKGITLARRRGNELEKAIDSDDEGTVVVAIRAVYGWIFATKPRYSLREEEDRANALIAERRVEELNPGVYQRIWYDANDGVAPSTTIEAGKKLRLTRKALENFLTGTDERHITLRRNVLSHEVEKDGWADNWRTSDAFTTYLHDELSDDYTDTGDERINSYVAWIADTNQFNPVLDVLETPFNPDKDGDPLKDIIQLMGIQDDSFSSELFTKWLMQCLALQYGCGGGEGVLTLTGAQGAGKTLLAKKLSMHNDRKPREGLFVGGVTLDPRDKDSVVCATSSFICELGELDGTFRRADIARIKGFVTLDSDFYRIPYSINPEHIQRRTAYIASVNNPKFLVDDTGNRRFWTIPVGEFDIEKLLKFDAAPLWRQVRTMLGENLEHLQAWRLSRDDQKKLQAVNVTHAKVLPGETELRDILAKANGEIYSTNTYELRKVSASDIVNEYTLKYSAQEVGRALANIPEVEQGKSHNTTWYNFPMRKFSSSSVYGDPETAE